MASPRKNHLGGMHPLLPGGVYNPFQRFPGYLYTHKPECTVFHLSLFQRNLFPSDMILLRIPCSRGPQFSPVKAFPPV